jgi:hypothetical protein
VTPGRAPEKRVFLDPHSDDRFKLDLDPDRDRLGLVPVPFKDVTAFNALLVSSGLRLMTGMSLSSVAAAEKQIQDPIRLV